MEYAELYFHKLTSVIGTFLQTNTFTTALVALATAFAGAYAGGRAAQIVSERNKQLNDVVKEMRATNAAISVAFSINNTLLNNKEQNIQPLKETFDAAKDEFDAVFKAKDTDYTPDNPYVFPADLEALSPPAVPIERLQKVLFEETSISGRPLSLVSMLAQSIHSLNETLTLRNDFISNMNAAPENEKIKLPFLYFGKPLADGSVDNRYPSFIKAIYLYTNDSVMFTKLLIEDLEEHGDALTQKHKKKFGKHLPKVHKVDFSIAGDKGLLPDPKDYENWTTSFQKHEKEDG